jgi:hypothetical protein
MSDYIPSKDADFDTFFKNLYQYVDNKTGGNQPEWTFIPSAARSDLNDALTAWNTAYEATKTPHTPIETLAKNAPKICSPLRAVLL